jgi:hypothetical protein
VAQVRAQQNFPPYSFVNICFFQTKSTWVNAECRDASKTTLITVGGLAHKKWFLYDIFLVKSVSTGKLYFAIWSGSIQSPYSLADRFKIHPIVRFYTWNIWVHQTDPISSGRGVKPAVKKHIISCQSPALFEKIAAACEESARNWDRDQKIGIFQSDPLHRAPIQNRPKTGENVDFPKSARFLRNFRVQHEALIVRRPKHPYLLWCTQIFLYEIFSRLVPRDSNLGHHTSSSTG